jgi:hypothetical protein
MQNRPPEEQAIINAVLSIFQQRFPSWMEQVVNPYLRELEQDHSNQRFNFSALLGETQQGKTLVMHLITWIMIFVHSYSPCYLTKKLSALRDDAMDKLNGGLVNTIIDQACTDLDCIELAKKFKLGGKVGLAVEGKCRAGTVPVFLMQPENNLKVLQWMRSIQGDHPVFFIDEVHELYPIKDYLGTQGLTLGRLEKGKIHNHALIHMIAQTCKGLGCTMLGITATPHRMLTSDPEVFPSRLFKIPCQAPCAGLVRIGYGDDSEEFEGATFHANVNVIQVVNEVLQRPSVTLSNGARQIRFLNIAFDHFNDDMVQTREIITENFTDQQVHVRLFIQGGVDYQDINCKDLDDFFNMSDVPESVITNGVIILIGKSREAAGITIKPSFKLTATGRHQRSVNGIIYTISGITDMMLKLPENMESAEQLFGRASGWFDPAHKVHFWLPEKQIQDVRTGVIQTKRALVNRYDGQLGPESVLKVQNMCTSITHFSPNGNYHSSQRRGHIGFVRSSKPPCASVAVELKTDVFTLPDEIYRDYLHARSLPKRGKTVEGRTVHTLIKQIMTERVGRGELLHISWDDKRRDIILKSAAQPREDSCWKVNGYVSVVDNSLVLVSFIEPWNSRPHFGYQCSNCSLGPCDQHFDQSGTIYWMAGTGMYQHTSYSRVMEHKHIKTIKNWRLGDEHQASLDRVDRLIKAPKSAKPKSLYHLFTRIHTLRRINKKRPAEILHQTWISQRWQQFKITHEALHQRIDTMVRASSGDDSLICTIDRMLDPYFSPVKKLPPPKLKPSLSQPKLRPKLRSRA